MHDFIQSPGFHASRHPGAPGAGLVLTRASAAMRCIMQSFDDDTVPFTAYRPTPSAPSRRRPRKPRSGGKSLNQ